MTFRTLMELVLISVVLSYLNSAFHYYEEPVLWFDDIQTRGERTQTEKLAQIGWLYEAFIMNCQKYYNNIDYVTLDEILESYRASFKALSLSCCYHNLNVRGLCWLSNPKDIFMRVLQSMLLKGDSLFRYQAQHKM